MSGWRLGVSKAEGSGCPTGRVGKGVLIAVVISQCSFAVITCDCGLLGVEGLMILMGLNDGEVQKFKVSKSFV